MCPIMITWEGRDDRLLSSHAREARFPFLDEDFATFLNSVPLHHICDLSQPPGTGDKRILREAAKKLGLHYASTFSKRAIQVLQPRLLVMFVVWK